MNDFAVSLGKGPRKTQPECLRPLGSCNDVSDLEDDVLGTVRANGQGS